MPLTLTVNLLPMGEEVLSLHEIALCMRYLLTSA